MRIALIGARGQLGTALQSALAGDVVPLDRSRIDIGDAGGIDACLSEVRPDLVINAAAYNFVDRAEQEPEAAHRVNALGPKYLAEYCEGHDAALVHVSSDYVFSGLVRSVDFSPRERLFDGSQHNVHASMRPAWTEVHATQPVIRTQPYRETDDPDPQSVYAASKLAGEEFVRSTCRRHFVLRTCGLYGRAESAGKGNFVKTMLRLAGERDELRVVNDQRCTPTSAADLAGWIAALIGTDAYGLYHATNAGNCTWYEFAVEIFQSAGRRVSVVPISTAEYVRSDRLQPVKGPAEAGHYEPSKAKRPPYSVLDCAKLQRVTGLTFRPWETALAEYVAEECRD